MFQGLVLPLLIGFPVLGLILWLTTTDKGNEYFLKFIIVAIILCVAWIIGIALLAIIPH